MKHSYLSGKDTKKTERIKNNMMTVLLMIAIILFIMSLVQTSIKIRKINREVKSRENQLEQVRKEEEELKRKYEEIISSEYMEKQLRNQLNLAKDNEIILILPEDDVLRKLVPQDTQEEFDDIRPNWRKWADVFGILE